MYGIVHNTKYTVVCNQNMDASSDLTFIEGERLYQLEIKFEHAKSKFWKMQRKFSLAKRKMEHIRDDLPNVNDSERICVARKYRRHYRGMEKARVELEKAQHELNRAAIERGYGEI